MTPRAVRAPAEIDRLLKGLASKTSQVKFGSAKALWLLAEEGPQLLYRHFDFFLGLLDGRNQIIRWNATSILACLAGGTAIRWAAPAVLEVQSARYKTAECRNVAIGHAILG
jgi:hypothetical protein